MSKPFEYSANWTREQRIESFKNAICKAIFEEECLISQEKFSYLLHVLPEYIKMKLGVEDIDFNYSRRTGNNMAYTLFADNIIDINTDFFHFEGTSEAVIDDLEKLVRLYDTIVHEISHVIDNRENIASGGTRTFIAKYNSSITEMSKIFPEKEQFYKSVSNAFYVADRGEIFARKSAEEGTRQFVEELKQYSKEKFPYTQQVQQEHESFLEYTNNNDKNTNLEPPNISEKTMAAINVGIKLRNIERKQNNICDDNKTLLDYNLVLKQKHLPELKEDFKKIAEKFFDPNCLDEEIVNFNPYTIEILLRIPELYDKKYAEKLYEYAKKHDIKMLCCFLSRNKDIAISNKERKENADFYQEIVELSEQQKKSQEINSENVFKI